jgi:hypothetical protein
MQDKKLPGGRGFYGLSKGAQITDLAALQVGDIILAHSLQFNAENTLQITDKQQYGKSTHLTAIYFDPVNNCRAGKEEVGLWNVDLLTGRCRYYRPEKPDDLVVPCYLSEGAQRHYSGAMRRYTSAADHVKADMLAEIERNVDRRYITDPAMLEAAKAFLTAVRQVQPV